MTRLILATIAVPLIGSMGSGAMAAPPPAAAALLRPLSHEDAVDGAGCGCDFVAGNQEYVSTADGQLAIRTAAGRQLCRPTEMATEAFEDGRGSVTCGAVRLTLRRLGRDQLHPESESTDWPALLTVTIGGRSQVIRGRFGCTC